MTSSEKPPGRLAFTLVHYGVPLAVVLYFVAAQGVAACSIARGKKFPKSSKSQKYTGIFLTLALVTLFLVEGALYCARAVVDSGWWAPKDAVLHVAMSVLLWGYLGLNFVDTAKPAWPAYAGAWLLGFVGEAAILALTLSSGNPSGGFDIAFVTLQSLRIVGLLAAALTVGGAAVQRPQVPAKDEERESLLGASDNAANYSATANDDTGESSSDEDDETFVEGESDWDDDGDDEDQKKIKKLQRKRLREEGGIFGYFKGFFIFFRVLNPKGHPKIQFFYLARVLFMLWHRFENVFLPNQLGVITRRLANDHNHGMLPWKEISIWMLVRFIGGDACIGFLDSYTEVRIENFNYKRIIEFGFNHVMSLSMDFHDSKESGEILRAAEQGLAISRLIDTMMFSVSPIFIDVVVGVVYITYLFDTYIAFIALATGIMYFWATVRLRTIYLPRRREFIKKSREENNIAYEAVSNWQTVSYFNRLEHEEQRYASAIDGVVASEFRYIDLANAVNAVLSIIMIVGRMSAIYLAAWRVVKGENDVGSFVTLVTFWSQLTYPLQQLAHEYRRISGQFVDAERLLEVVRTKPSVTSKPGAPDLAVEGGAVTFEDVGFAYDQRKQILSDFAFTAKPGQTVALVGETGGGKSTTLKLLFRYYDVTQGSIKIDGQDVRDVSLDSLRESIGLVPQDPSLFNRSILENVRYARLDATDEEVFEACKAAAIHDKIMTFPDGYNSKVGERGVKVSGGEKQRIAIARIILKNPKIVMLDEATSAVDSSTEQLIQEAFKRLSKSRTTFVIAHRLSTIVEADQILVVDAGKIVERGTHDELIAKDGRYKQLWRKQTREARKEAEAALSPPTSGTATASGSHTDLIQLNVPDQLAGNDSDSHTTTETADNATKDD